MRMVSYKDVLPPGLVYRVRSELSPADISLVQQLVNTVGKMDTSETYRERALSWLEKHKQYLSDREYRLLLEVVEYVVQMIDYVKKMKYGVFR